MFEQHRLYLGRRDGEALVFDHFFAAVDDPVEAFAVAGDNITGPVPAVAQHGSGGLRFLPIAKHKLWSAHGQFSGYPGWGFRYVVRGIRRIGHARTTIYAWL